MWNSINDIIQLPENKEILKYLLDEFTEEKINILISNFISNNNTFGLAFIIKIMAFIPNQYKIV